MNLDALDFHLPPQLIAQFPAEPRDTARLLVVRRATGELIDSSVSALPECLQSGDLLVANQSFVLPARFWLRRSTGGRVEGLFIRARELAGSAQTQTWEVMLRGAERVREGERLAFDASAVQAALEVLERLGQGRFVVRPDSPASPAELLEQVGTTPLPPYIGRSAGPHDRQRYQAVYADPAKPGSVAAPTAGLHFTPGLLDRIEKAGVRLAYCTLHVGPGTFAPVKSDQLSAHEMHSEVYEVPAATADAIRTTKLAGGRVLAVGTTSVRTLETTGGQAGSGWTSLFIYPPYQPKVVDLVMTNFHLPRSTLLALVMAFAGEELTRKAYRHAICERYRFYSYGDAMLIV